MDPSLDIPAHHLALVDRIISQMLPGVQSSRRRPSQLDLSTDDDEVDLGGLPLAFTPQPPAYAPYGHAADYQYGAPATPPDAAPFEDDTDRFGLQLVAHQPHIDDDERGELSPFELNRIVTDAACLHSDTEFPQQPLTVVAFSHQEEDDEAASFYQPSEASDPDSDSDPEYGNSHRRQAATPGRRTVTQPTTKAASPDALLTPQQASSAWVVPSTLEACPDVRSNNKMAEDKQWSLEEMTMGVTELNRYMKKHGFTSAQMKELRLARRRMKGRIYSRDHRVKKSTGRR